ncbi:MAG: HAMP domain-containing histidine kinase [Bacteroidales bacterium]|nr:HAMP domain-containing histidine kinase [Bacteroidales bacterium]
MNKKLTALIISLVTIASIGLLFIQVYWIKNALQVRRAAFNRDVNQAMSQVKFALDKLRYQDYYLHSREFYKKNQNVYAAFDSINQAFYSHLTPMVSADDIARFLEKRSQLSQAYQKLFNSFREVNDTDFFSENKPVIDSLINTYLDQKNIKTPYEFGIFNPFKNAMIYQSTGKYPNQLLNNSFVYNLAPIGSNMELPLKFLIYFPKEQSFIISSLYKLLFVSVLLFVIVIGSFYFSIHIIQKQKKLSEMKNDLINNMTHEFKTPISTISLACEVLRDKDIQKSDDIYQQYVKIIDEENKRLSTMSEEILRSATIEHGKLKLNQEHVNLNNLINNAIKSKALSAQNKGGSIVTKLEATQTELYGDKVHLTNIFINLIDNAIKYNLEVPFVEVYTKNLKQGVLISVKDNGIGISKSNQKKVFDKLYRVPTGNVHNFKGFGLGLNYVKAIVEQHNGKITIESELGKGSIFHVYLPNENSITHG